MRTKLYLRTPFDIDAVKATIEKFIQYTKSDVTRTTVHHSYRLIPMFRGVFPCTQPLLPRPLAPAVAASAHHEQAQPKATATLWAQPDHLAKGSPNRPPESQASHFLKWTKGGHCLHPNHRVHIRCPAFAFIRPIITSTPRHDFRRFTSMGWSDNHSTSIRLTQSPIEIQCGRKLELTR